MIDFISIVLLSVVAIICAFAIVCLLYSISVTAFKLVLMCFFLWLLIAVINYISAPK
jgi:hypothetical protein